MKHFIELMRAVLLQGAGVRDVVVQLAALASFGVVVLSLGGAEVRAFVCLNSGRRRE